MAGRQRRHRVVGLCENRSFWSLVGRYAGYVRSAQWSLAGQPSEKSLVNDRRQRCQTVSGLEDSPLQAALRTPGLRSVLRSRELWRALVRKAHAKRSNQNYRSRALLVFGGTIVGKAARTMRDPAAPFQTTSLNDAYVLAAMRVCARRSRHSFARCHFRIQRMLSQHEMLPQIENPKARPNKTRYRANWLPRNWLTGHCALAALPRSFLLCLSNLFGLVL